MRLVLDTNVVVSAIFFGGFPGRILEAWRGALIQIVLSLAIFEEYRRVGEAIGGRFPEAGVEKVLTLLVIDGEFVEAPRLRERVCVDPDDDKFLACAVASGVPLIVSGDDDLLSCSGWSGIRVLAPRAFVDEFLA